MAKILGLTYSIPSISEENTVSDIYGLGHDSAAVLLEDGEVISAFEEERLNRIKHTHKAPILSIRKCLESSNLRISDIDKFAINFKESTINTILRNKFIENPERGVFLNSRQLLKKILFEVSGEDVDESKFCFVPHQIAHAESAFLLSGFEESLVLTMDGIGDKDAGIIQIRSKHKSITLDKIPLLSSLGIFYNKIILHLGYRLFEEYKVMGLAPYGDPQKYYPYFRKFYRLLPEGKFEINSSLFQLLYDICLPRKKGEPIEQVHKDIAAALQYSLEEIVLHLLKHYKKITNQSNLCIAGGVAQNCSLNYICSY